MEIKKIKTLKRIDEFSIRDSSLPMICFFSTEREEKHSRMKPNQDNEKLWRLQ